MPQPTDTQLKLILAYVELDVDEVINTLADKVCSEEINNGWSHKQIRDNFTMRQVKLLRMTADVIERELKSHDTAK